MSSWLYSNPVKIHFGPGIIKKLPEAVGPGNSVLITTPGFTKRGITDLIKQILGSSLVKIFDGVRPNPTFRSIKTAFSEFRQCEYDSIIALGGGSVIDTAKAVAAMEASGEASWIFNHLKQGTPFPGRFVPKQIIAVPTTAGSGSEVTMWATIWDMEEKQKYSISHYLLYPRQAVLDPELTITLPERETLYSGLDAFSHAMESIWNKNHNPVSDLFALKAISLVNDYLPELKKDLNNIELRTQLLYASLFAGRAFSNTKTALAHSISYPLTANFGLPHGLACALPLPHILKFNGDKAFKRIVIMAEALKTDREVDSMFAAINKLFQNIGINSSLIDHGIDKSKAGLIVDLSVTRGRADNNIVEFNHEDIVNLVQSLF